MGLTGALNVGRSGLLTSQTALQVTGNNLANVATEGFRRQTVSLSPVSSQRIGQNLFVGRGVQLQAITRQIDEALEARLRGAIADQSRSTARQDLLGQIESIEAELSTVNLSTRLGALFDAFRRLEVNPQDSGARQLVVNEAESAAGFIQNLNQQYLSLRDQADASLASAVSEANDLLTRLETLDQQITVQDRGTGQAGALRDQRDGLLGELATFLDISTIEQPNGSVSVFVGSLPIFENGQSRGLELRTPDTGVEASAPELILTQGQQPLELSSGKFGAMIAFRQNDLADTLDTLDTLAGQLVHQVNLVHTQGQALAPLTDATGTYAADDPALSLADPASGLPFAARNGTLQVHVTDAAGNRTATTVKVNIGVPGTADTTLDSLAADLDAIDGLSAIVTPDGRLRLTADGDGGFAFSDDTAGVLAAVGVGTFFDGSEARDIAVAQAVRDDPSLIAASLNHNPADNQNARRLGALGDLDAGIPELGGRSLTGYWNRHVEDFAARLGQTRDQVSADGLVVGGLKTQQQAISGVNADEETIDMLQFQRAFQASARFITVVDELLDTLINLV